MAPHFFERALALLVALLAIQVAQPICSAEPGLSWESEFRFSLVGDAEFTNGEHEGDVSALDFRLRAVASIPTGSGMLLRAGLDFEQSRLDAADSLSIPDEFQAASLVLGADILVGEAIIFRLEVQPGFYGGSTSLRQDDFNAPITLGAIFFASADLQFVAGVSIDANRKYPVLPGAGVRWKIAPEWVLNAILPKPRLEYTIGGDLLLYAGAEFRGGTFRTDGDFGDTHANPKLKNAFVSYTQIRAGLGAAWKLSSAATIELEAGVVPVHQLDYHRAEFRMRSEDLPPYGGINVRLKF